MAQKQWQVMGEESPNMKWPMCSELPIFISSLLSQILPRQVLFAELCCGQQKLLGGLICLTKRKEKETLWVREVGGILVFCFHSPLFFFFLLALPWGHSPDVDCGFPVTFYSSFFSLLCWLSETSYSGRTAWGQQK